MKVFSPCVRFFEECFLHCAFGIVMKKAEFKGNQRHASSNIFVTIIMDS